MKEFFSNKLNILLCIVLALLVGAGIFFAVNVLQKEPVRVIDFTNMTETEIIAWAKENKVEDKLEITHEYSDDIKEDYPIYVSLKVDSEIEDKLLVIISDGIDYSKYIEIVFNKTTTKEDLDAFFQEKGITNVEYVYEEKENYESGRIISVNPDLVKGDEKVVVTLAKGKLIEVPDFNYYTKIEINDWAKANSMKVEYEYQNSKNQKDTVISQSVKAGEMVEQGVTLNIVLSTGVSTAKTYATIPETYLGTSEESFLKNVKALGFTKFKKESDRYYSVRSKKDTIYSYDSGYLDTSSTIQYAISNGQYTFDKTKFEDVNLSTVKALVEDYNDHNAHIDFSYEKTNTTAHKNGVVYDCTSSFNSPYTTISCKLANNNSSSTTETTGKICTDACWLGKKESDFVSAVEKLGFKPVVDDDRYYSLNSEKDTIYSYDHDDGKTYPKGTTVNYALSNGKYIDNFDSDDYNGLTIAKAESVIDKYNKFNARINTTIATTTVKTNEHTSGTLYDCSAKQVGNETKISCNLAAKKDSTTYKVKSLTSNPCGNDTSCTLDSIKYSITYEYSETIDKDAVISQSIPANTEVEAGTTVNVKISKGKEPITTYTVPTITSNPCGSATSCTLDNIKYEVSYNTSDTVKKDDVISQSINPGQKVAAGTTVEVLISKGPETKKILDFNDYQTTSLNYHSVEDTKTWMTSILGSFKLSFVTSSSKDYSIGTLISISVNGNTNYEAGDYPLSTVVVVTICDSQG